MNYRTVFPINMRKHLIILFSFIVAFSIAQIPSRPNPPKLYNNLSQEFPDFLNSSEAAQLEEKLEVFSNETSNQICVVIVDDLNGYEASEFAFKLGEEWGVGQKDKDNGIVILIKPTQENGGRSLFIATGYGLEGAIPDLATKRIRENEMNPYLKKGDYFTALDKGTDVLMQLAKGEVDVKNYTRGNDTTPGGGITAIIILIIVIILLRIIFGGGRGGGGRTFSSHGAAFLLGSMFGGRGHGGSGFGGGSSGGGFGGFGGGSFGGGGSGGSW